MDDFELDLVPTASLELDGEAAPARKQSSRKQPPAGYGTLDSIDEDFALDEAIAVEAAAEPVDTRPWPLGRTNEAKQSALTPEDIVKCGNYGNGKPPFYLAPAYTWRVWNRRQELARQLKFLQNELNTRESERDRLLVELALSLTADLEKQERFDALLAELAAAKRPLERREQTLATTNAVVSKAVRVHDAELTRLEAERGERAKLAGQRRRERDAKAADHQRASTKLNRVEIEIRNATERARAIVGPEGGTLPALLAQQLSGLNALEASLVREVEQRKGELEVANRALAESEQPVAETQRQIDAVHEKKALTIANSRRKLESESSQARTAKSAHTEVAKRIALTVLDLKGAIFVDRITLDRIQGADDRVEVHLTEVEKLTLALDAYDHETYGLGIKLTLAPFVLALVFLLLRPLL